MVFQDESNNKAVAINHSKAPIFIHSGFRTSSTWLWNKFRDNNSTISYCEIFHENLSQLSFKNISEASNSSWISRHPQSAPYFLEYLPLVKSTGGVVGYEKEMAYSTYIPRQGLNGSIDESEKVYVGSLIKLALDANKTPVLTCTRTLGRISGIREAFGGFHILLIRNLFSQWLSYIYQSNNGNGHFVCTIFWILENHSKDNFICYLKDFLVGRTDGDLNFSNSNTDDVFLVFLIQHIYFYMNAVNSVDYIFGVTEIACLTAEGVSNIEKELSERIGLSINIGDIRNEPAPAVFTFLDFESTLKYSEILFDEACRQLDANQVQISFGRKLLNDTFSYYKMVRPVFENSLVELGKLNASLEKAKSEYSILNSDSLNTRESLHAQIEQGNVLDHLVQTLTAERNGLQQQLVNAEHVKSKITDDHEKAVSEGSALRLEVQVVQANLIAESEKVTSLDGQLQSCRIENETLQNQLTKVTQLRDEALSNLENMKSKMEMDAFKNSELVKYKVAELQNRIEDQGNYIALLKNTCDEFKIKVTDLQSLAQFEKDKVNSLIEKNADLSNRIKLISSRNILDRILNSTI